MADLQVTQEIVIDLDDKSPFDYIIAKQGDKSSRVISITLLLNKQTYVIPSGTTARIKYYKPDGNEVLNNCTISGNKILVTYTEQMLAAAGTGKGEIVLTKDSKELKSATFYTKIVENVYKTEGFVSDKEFLSFAAVLNSMDQAAQAASANANIASTAASNANNKASLANTAANSANTAASSANTAAKSANDATTKANSATSAANTAANNATSAANSANNATSAANTATTATKNATTLASQATTSANNAAASANAAAKACEGIVAKQNTMIDTVTKVAGVLSLEDGILCIREA